MNEWFRKFSVQMAEVMGSFPVFLIAIISTLIWLVSGPIFKFNEAWNFIANTSTTIITFLMVFLIQNTQNRDTKALQLKLDELIRASKRARNELVDLENLTDKELDGLQKEFQHLRKNHPPADDLEQQPASPMGSTKNYGSALPD